MPHNHGFQRAAVCLTHPTSLVALMLLLLNDHLFWAYWSSWWTGKEVVYRIVTGKIIERSSDGGQTWITEFQPRQPPQAVQAYLAKNNPGGTRFKKTPLDAAFDPQSGNLIFAMGFDGVLVRQPDGKNTEVGVGVYQSAEPGIGQLLLTICPGEVLMALIFGGLGVLILEFRRKHSLIPRLLTGATGILWVFIALGIPPAIEGYGYPEVFVMLALGASGLALLPVVVIAFIASDTSSRALFNRYLLVFLGGALLFIIPFITWALNILPNFRLTQFLGITLGHGWIYEQFRRRKSA